VIVRINQLDVRRAEEEADWASQGMLGPLWYTWPANTRVFEFLILDHDEQKQSLDQEFRQKQLRKALPHAIAAMREAGEEIVIRLDGPLTADEMLPAFAHLTESDLTGRFCISPVSKLDPAPVEIIGSVRIQPSPQTCSEICLDPNLGLHRSVRLRAFGVPEEWVEPLLMTNEAEDQRWREILPHAGFALSTTRGLGSLQLTTRRLDANEVKSRLMERLMMAARPPHATSSYR
jgi:hypothetical protein